MTAALPTAFIAEGMTTVMMLAAPLLLVLALVGTLVGIIQAATQINDPALGFLPRVFALGVTAWLTGGWMVEKLAVLVAHNLTAMGGGAP